MAGQAIGPRIEVKGKSEFIQSLKEIDAGMRLHKANLALVTAEYGKNQQSAEALTARGEVLANMVGEQTAKVEELQRALADSASRYGEADIRTMNWQKRLYEAEAALLDTTRKLDENTEALGRTDRAVATTTSNWGSLGDVVRKFADIAGIKIPPALNGVVTKLDKVSASGAALVGVLGGIVVGLTRLTTEAAKSADELLTLASTSGMTTDRIQELQYAADLINVPFETMDKSMTTLIRSMGMAQRGSGDARDAFAKLRIGVQGANGTLRDSNKVFYEVIDKLSKVRNETERDAISMQLFGLSARELNPLLEQGSARLRELSEEAHNVGYVMDEQTIQKFKELDEAMERFGKVGETLKSSLAMALLPVLTALFDALSKIPAPVLQTLVVLAGVITTVVLAVKAVKELTSTGKAIVGFFTEINPAALKTTAIVLGVVAALVLLAIAIAAIAGKSGELQASIAGAGQMVTDMQKPVQNLPRYARGTSFHPGGKAIVGEEGPEIVELPRGSRVYPNGRDPQGVTNNYISVTSRDMQNASMAYAVITRGRQQGRAR